jgi:hypothetical protein
MAFDLLNLVWSHRGLKPLQKLVLARIADRINVNTRTAKLGINSIAPDCSLSHQGTRNLVDQLIALGLLRVVEEAHGRTARLYSINADALLVSNAVAHNEASEQPDCSQGESEQPGCSQPSSDGAELRATAPQLASNGADVCEQRREGLRATGLLTNVLTVGTVQENRRGGAWNRDGVVGMTSPVLHGDCLAHGPICLKPRVVEQLNLIGLFNGNEPALRAWAEKVCERWTLRIESGAQCYTADQFKFWRTEYDNDFKAAAANGHHARPVHRVAGSAMPHDFDYSKYDAVTQFDDRPEAANE